MASDIYQGLTLSQALCSILYQDLSPSALDMRSWIILCGGDHPVHGRMLAAPLALTYQMTVAPTPIVTTTNVSRPSQMPITENLCLTHIVPFFLTATHFGGKEPAALRASSRCWDMNPGLSVWALAVSH